MSLFSKYILRFTILSILTSINAYSSENSILDETDHAYIQRLGVSSKDYIDSRLKILKEEKLDNINNIKYIDIALKCLNITKPEYLEASTNAKLLKFTILDYLTAYKIAQQKNIDIKFVSSDEIKAEHLGYNLSQYYVAQRVSEKLKIDISEVTFRQINEENQFIKSTKYQLLTDNEKEFLHGITKVDDCTYYQDLPDLKARLMMERLDNNNVERWKKFASNETQNGDKLKTLIAEKQHIRLTGYADDGAIYFEKVIDLYFTNSKQVNSDQIWIAYMSDDFDISPQKINYDRWEKSILYCMTVVTSPEALITSHMGINKTINGVAKKIKGDSIKIHRFASMVMLSLNKERRFMINTPAWVMESIMADALPKGLYAGTREMTTTVDPSIYVERKGGKQEPLYKFLTHHPPIISLGHKGRRIEKEMIIYDHPLSQNIFLKISSENRSTYNWIFSEPFQPVGSTHYIAVDLLKLAQ